MNLRVSGSACVPLGIVILDTNVGCELMRPAPDMQVLDGMSRFPLGRRRTLLPDAADEVFDGFADRVLSFDTAAADEYGDIVIEREQAGVLLSGFDAQIAAISRSRRATLVTRNTDDFTRLDLDVIDPWLIDI